MPSKRSVPRTCEQCGKEFLATPSDVKHGWGRFCSRKCRSSKVGERGTIEERFWSKVDKGTGQGPKGECWMWIGALTGKGYGKMTINHKGASAHVIAYQIQRGPIEDGVQVLHHCDMPACVRGDHLFKGSQLDNMLDRAAKERHWRKLTPEQVLEIRDGSLAGMSQQAIADKYGVTQNLISKILLRQSRKHG